MTTIYVDIETIPTQRPDIMARIAAKHGLNDEKALEEHRKTSLNAAAGEIYCIGFAFDDEPVQVLTRQSMTLTGERELLRDFVNVVWSERAAAEKNLIFVAHNAEFDRNFIRQRLLVHGIEAPRALTGAGQKPWENAWQCTMQMWCGNMQGRISLDDLALALGCSSKDELHGSKVWDAVLAGEGHKVVDHCRQDIEVLREVHKRLA